MKENELQKALQEPAKRKKKKNFLKINLKKYKEGGGSITSLDNKLFKQKTYKFQEANTTSHKRKIKKQFFKANSMKMQNDKKFAMCLVKQSFMKINKDLLGVKVKRQLKLADRKANVKNVLLNEIVRKKNVASYYDTFSNSEEKLGLFTTFIKTLKRILHFNGFKSDSREITKKKRKLRNIIEKNFILFKNSKKY